MPVLSPNCEVLIIIIPELIKAAANTTACEAKPLKLYLKKSKNI